VGKERHYGLNISAYQCWPRNLYDVPCQDEVQIKIKMYETSQRKVP
jgi:hypothetical protein